METISNTNFQRNLFQLRCWLVDNLFIWSASIKKKILDFKTINRLVQIQVKFYLIPKETLSLKKISENLLDHRMTWSRKFSSKVKFYLLKVSNRNTRTRSEICSKLARKTPWTNSTPCSSVSIVNFKHIIADWTHSSQESYYHFLQKKARFNFFETIINTSKKTDISLE